MDNSLKWVLFNTVSGQITKLKNTGFASWNELSSIITSLYVGPSLPKHRTRPYGNPKLGERIEISYLWTVTNGNKPPLFAVHKRICRRKKKN